MSAFLSDEPVTFTIPERRYCTLCSLACAHLVVTFLAFGGGASLPTATPCGAAAPLHRVVFVKS